MLDMLHTGGPDIVRGLTREEKDIYRRKELQKRRKLNSPQDEDSDEEYISTMNKLSLAFEGPKEDPLEKLALTIAKVMSEPLDKLANTIDRAIKLATDLP